VTSAKASLRIFPGEATAASVSDRLGILADESHEVGDDNPRSGRPWKNALWTLRSTLPETEPLSAHLAELLDRVAGVSEVLTAMHSEGYQMDWFCYVYRDNGQGGPSFEPEVLLRLGGLPAVLDLDVY